MSCQAPLSHCSALRYRIPQHTATGTQRNNSTTCSTMVCASRTILFVSAIFSSLLREGLPFVVPLPSAIGHALSSPSSGARGGLSPATTAAAGSQAKRFVRSRGGEGITMSMADVCHGDFPTPGWVRLAQRNLARVSVGDQLPDSTVRYAIVCES